VRPSGPHAPARGLQDQHGGLLCQVVSEEVAARTAGLSVEELLVLQVRLCVWHMLLLLLLLQVASSDTLAAHAGGGEVGQCWCLGTQPPRIHRHQSAEYQQGACADGATGVMRRVSE
jgi:hypothetical protein